MEEVLMCNAELYLREVQLSATRLHFSGAPAHSGRMRQLSVEVGFREGARRAISTQLIAIRRQPKVTGILTKDVTHHALRSKAILLLHS